MVEQYKSDDGTVWWFSGILLIKQILEQWKSNGETVWWYGGTVMVEK